MNIDTTLRPVGAAVAAIHSAYDEYARGFEEITSRARRRFELRDWAGSQSDATARLELYKAHVDAAVADVRDILDDAVMERTVWGAMKLEHASRVGRRLDAELAESFFNSVTRRVFSTVGVDPAIEYLQPAAAAKTETEPEIYVTHSVFRVEAELIHRILSEIPWTVPYAQLDRDAALVAELIESRVPAGILGQGTPPARAASLDFLPKQRRVSGWPDSRRLSTIPLVLPLLHAERGIVVDAVLMSSDRPASFSDSAGAISGLRRHGPERWWIS